MIARFTRPAQHKLTYMRFTTRLGTAAVAACLSLFVVVCFPMFRNNLPYLDDAYLILMQKQLGFWAPTDSFRSMWGGYRLIYTTLMSFVYSMGDHLWMLRTFGLAVHMLSALLLLHLTGRLNWAGPTRAVVFVLFLFFPYCLEATAWPSNVTQYPFAPFLMLSGISLVLARAPSARKTAFGAFLMGAAAWFHEQIGPLTILLVIVAAAGLPRKVGIRAAVITIATIAANFVVIFATREGNPRLTGEGAGSLRHALNHSDYAWQVFRTTPLGDFYYATGGLPSSPVLWTIIAAVALLVFCAAYSARDRLIPDHLDRAWNEPQSAWFLPAIFLLAAGAYLVSLIPILMTPIPWHTSRVVYIPFLGFTITVGALIELILRSRHLARFATPAVAVLACCTLVWSAAALRAEANAFDFQTRVNHQRVHALNTQIGAELRQGKTFVVGGGYYDADQLRPLFGEHFTSLTLSELKAALGMTVHLPPPYPNAVTQAHWGHVCSNAQGRLEYLALNADAKVLKLFREADRVLIAMWVGDRWLIQRPVGEPSDAIPVPPQVQPCEKARAQ